MKHGMKGVTLAEILVVIAIILLLIAILIPVQRQSVSSAKSTVCASNLHQYFLALDLYVESSGSFPPSDPQGPALAQYQVEKLDCPNRKPGGVSYAAFWPHAGSNLPYEKSLWACYRAREGDFPLMIDANHVVGSIGIGTPASNRIHVLRANGSVSTIAGNSVGTVSEPCDLNVLSIFMNN